MIDFDRINEELRIRGFDVDRIVDGLGKHIEPKIKPLVLALNYKGYKTQASCEGHSLSETLQSLAPKINAGKKKLVFVAKYGLTFKEKRGPFGLFSYTQTFNENPWVDVNLYELQLGTVEKILVEHARNTGIEWGITEFAHPKNYYRISAIPKYNLVQMQNDIPILAQDFIEKTI